MTLKDIRNKGLSRGLKEMPGENLKKRKGYEHSKMRKENTKNIVMKTRRTK